MLMRIWDNELLPISSMRETDRVELMGTSCFITASILHSDNTHDRTLSKYFTSIFL